MIATRVKALHYDVVSSEFLDFENAAPIVHETAEFKMRLADDSACFEMKGHVSTMDEARAIVEPFAKDWEIQSGLEHSPGDFRLVFKRAEIVDQEQESPRRREDGPKVVSVRGTAHVHSSMDAILHIHRGAYPTPPTKFLSSPEVDMMYQRYKAYQEGREPLASMAYWCLTVLEASTGQRQGARAAASAKYYVDLEVLSKLGSLSSEKGGVEARKAKALHQDYTPEEKAWIHAVIKRLIQQVGELAFDPQGTLLQLTMAEFPALNA